MTEPWPPDDGARPVPLAACDALAFVEHAEAFGLPRDMVVQCGRAVHLDDTQHVGMIALAALSGGPCVMVQRWTFSPNLDPNGSMP